MSKLYIFLLFITSSSFATGAQLDLPMHINMVVPRLESSALRQMAEAIYKKSFKRLGVTVSFSSCAPAYCGKYVTDGKADAEAARALVYEEIYPTLVRASEEIITIKISAFSANPSIKLNTWNDLLSKKYKVAYIDQVRIIDKNIKRLLNPSNIVPVNHWEDGLNKLSNNKADIYIGVEKTIRAAIKNKETSIHKVGTLEIVDLYPYFNKKHILLAAKLSSILKEMKKDGTISTILSGQ